MPAPIHVIIIAPLAQVTPVQTATGLLCTSPLYTSADPTPRTETHRARSGPVNASQRIAVDAAKIDPAFADVIFEDWPKDQPSPYPGLLSGAGLTTSSTV